MLRITPRQTCARMLAAMAAPIFLCATAIAQCHYTYVEIPNPPGWYAYPEAINTHGHVAGRLVNLGETRRAFRWTPEAGTVIVPFPPEYFDSIATDINDNGKVVGSVGSIATGWRGFIWDGETITYIDRPAEYGQIWVEAINNDGTVVGHLSGLTADAFVYRDGVVTVLREAIQQPTSQALDVNNLDEIGGRTYSSQELWRSFVIFVGEFGWLTDVPEATGTFFYGLSDGQFAVGAASFPAPGSPPVTVSGVSWSSYGITLVEPPEGTRIARLVAVRGSGRAVGHYSSGDAKAIVSQFGTTRSLRGMTEPRPSFAVWEATDINARGEIPAITSRGGAVFYPHWLVGDITGDCHVLLDDLALVLTQFGSPPTVDSVGDVDLDGDVDLADLAIVLAGFGV